MYKRQDQFHSPANLAKSIVIEAAELLECFQWSDEEYDLQHIKAVSYTHLDVYKRQYQIRILVSILSIKIFGNVEKSIVHIKENIQSYS